MSSQTHPRSLLGATPSTNNALTHRSGGSRQEDPVLHFNRITSGRHLRLNERMATTFLNQNIIAMDHSIDQRISDVLAFARAKGYTHDFIVLPNGDVKIPNQPATEILLNATKTYTCMEDRCSVYLIDTPDGTAGLFVDYWDM